MYELLNEAIRMGKPLYTYSYPIYGGIRCCKTIHQLRQRYCENPFFRPDKKEVLKPFTRVFTPGRLDETLILPSQVPKERLMEMGGTTRVRYSPQVG
jgi:hypothetical protein